MTKEEKVLPDPILSKIGSTILFVDDEEDIVNLGEKILNLIGCKVVPFTNSLEALKAFDAEPQGYDMIITDQTMPGLTGFEFARKALEIRPDIPIILSTGYSETVNEAMAKELGIKEFILKPHTVDNLTKTILKLQKQTASG